MKEMRQERERERERERDGELHVAPISFLRRINTSLL